MDTLIPKKVLVIMDMPIITMNKRLKMKVRTMDILTDLKRKNKMIMGIHTVAKRKKSRIILMVVKRKKTMVIHMVVKNKRIMDTLMGVKISKMSMDIHTEQKSMKTIVTLIALMTLTPLTKPMNLVSPKGNLLLIKIIQKKPKNSRSKPESFLKFQINSCSTSWLCRVSLLSKD